MKTFPIWSPPTDEGWYIQAGGLTGFPARGVWCVSCLGFCPPWDPAWSSPGIPSSWKWVCFVSIYEVCRLSNRIWTAAFIVFSWCWVTRFLLNSWLDLWLCLLDVVFSRRSRYGFLCTGNKMQNWNFEGSLVISGLGNGIVNKFADLPKLIKGTYSHCL